ncbi:MAG: TolC family protein, partial [Acidobacteriaceae bacterium]|nr:TolC family protein [Acidobacteriaceae bacterium]
MLCWLLFAACVAVAGGSASAQISFTAAVDLALTNSPRVKMAEADASKALAALEQARDVYIPNLTGGSSLGYSYGFPVGQPSVFNFQTQSLLLNFSQRDYIRAARSALDAANLALHDVRQAVAEDAAVTYLTLDRDQQRVSALRDQAGYAARLVAIVEDRLDAGQSTKIELTAAQLSAARIRVAQLNAEDDQAAAQLHLSQLTELPAGGLRTIPESIPAITAKSEQNAPAEFQWSPAVESAYANAKSKQLIARGDGKYELRPQIYFAAQYNRYAEFNNYPNYYLHFQHNNAGVGVEITLPVFDIAHRARARESAAEAARAQHQADNLRDQFIETQQKARRATEELRARADVAELDQKLA